MTPEQKAAFLISQSMCAMIEAEGMKAENMQREACGNSMAYVEEDFLRLIEKWAIHHNAAMEYMKA